MNFCTGKCEFVVSKGSQHVLCDKPKFGIWKQFLGTSCEHGVKGYENPRVEYKDLWELKDFFYEPIKGKHRKEPRV